MVGMATILDHGVTLRMDARMLKQNNWYWIPIWPTFGLPLFMRELLSYFFNATVPFCFLLSASKFNPNWKSEAEKGESRMKKMKEQSLR